VTTLNDINWQTMLQLLAAIVLSLPTAWHWERNSQIMGLRTFPLVAMGACAYILIGESFIGPEDTDARARMMQGLVSGIGFVGGGAILQHKDHVRGTASAAAIWVIGALGAAVALELWAVAVVLSALNFLLVLSLTVLKPEMEDQS